MALCRLFTKMNEKIGELGVPRTKFEVSIALGTKHPQDDDKGLSISFTKSPISV